ncbi:uncharacterized protein LOC110727706 [Chenopodium quinoa]|uniref:uncharacterized protein LOC110727706 n=1 Tax=Chenopodium quinoa TaxID=63459 RepID=UPI000B794554|nr:uncharacterized protein LOC110727706 [Chenopodium quinoa]
MFKEAGNKEFLKVLREVVRINKPIVLALMETHMGYNGHTRIDAQGFSGGIWVYWKTKLVTVDPIEQRNQYITMEITKIGEEPRYFSAIYASPDPSKRTELWNELAEFANRNNKPWLLAGDFNETRFTYTWARGNSVETRRSARLDRALCTGEWGMRFDKAQMRHLPALQSDHCPIFISPNGFVPLEAVNRPFRFQAAWLTHEKFSDFIHEKWDSTAPLVPKLKALSSDLQLWNKEIFHNIFREKRNLMARIEGIKKKLSHKRNSGLIKLVAKLRRELDTVLNQEELMWYQKARVDWLKHGDRNTTFFQMSTVVRRWKNNIVAIKNQEDQWVYDKDQVKGIVVDYFANLFKDEGNEEEQDIPSGVSTEFEHSDWCNLVRPFTKCDIELAVNSLGSLKAPGPDGFQAIFYQKNWELVAPNVYAMALPTLEGRGLPDTINETFLVLLIKL